MNKFKVNISGMTCTGCEKHVESALEKIGAKNIESSYRRGEAVFELPDDIRHTVSRTSISMLWYCYDRNSADSTTRIKFCFPVGSHIVLHFRFFIPGHGYASCSTGFE